MKPQLFQSTKQTILKNKQQFIQIQINEIAKRISALKNDNMKLKTQIKQLKTKQTSVKKITLTVKQCKQLKQGKQNKSNNLNKTNSTSKDYQYLQKLGKNKQTDQQRDLQTLQLNIKKQELQKEKQLAYFQDLVKLLKNIWSAKQGEMQNISKCPSNRSSNASLYMLLNENTNINQINKNQQPSIKQFKIQKQIVEVKLEPETQNRAIPNKIQIRAQEPRRKTMSVNLNNSMNQSGFQFGKKMRQKQIVNQHLQGKQKNTCQNNTQNLSFSSSFINSQSECGYNVNQTANRSISYLSKSNSRASNSFMSMNDNRSELRQMQTSKSYAKIVTKLQCRGCKNQYRPNEYYSHIEKCWQLQKLQLLQQKSKIQDEINQTLNLSFPNI